MMSSCSKPCSLRVLTKNSLYNIFVDMIIYLKNVVIVIINLELPISYDNDHKHRSIMFIELDINSYTTNRLVDIFFIHFIMLDLNKMHRFLVNGQ